MKELIKKDFSAKPKKKSIKLHPIIVTKYFIYFAAMTILAFAEIRGIRPFSWGMYLALIFAGQNIVAVSLLYVLANFVAVRTINSLIISLSATLVLMIAAIVHFKIKKPISLLMLYVYAFLGQGGYLYVCIVNRYNVLNSIITFAFGLMFLYACVTVFCNILLRKLKYRLNKNDLACMAMYVIAIYCGLASIDIVGTIVARAFFALTVLLLLYASGSGAAVGYGICCGLGVAFATGDITYVASFGAMALVGAIFYEVSRILSAISLTLTDIIFGLFFTAYQEYDYLSVVALLVGGICYIIIPKSVLNRARDLFMGANETLGARHIINRVKAQLWRRLKEMSKIFNDMGKVFYMSVSSGVGREKTESKLVGELSLKLCSQCALQEKCYEKKEDIMLSLEDVIKAGLEKGRVTILEVPQYMTVKCEKINALIAEANEIVDNYRRRTNAITNLDTSKKLVAEQLCGISNMLLNVANETRNQIAFDLNCEQMVLEELTYNDIICQEVIINEESSGIKIVSLVAMEDTYSMDKLLYLTSKVLRQRLMLVSEENAGKEGWNYVTLKTAPCYDMVFGAAFAPKANNTLSGDSHSFVKIDDDKFLIALCDGMGTGEDAERHSANALSLIENFYRAGFDSDTVISGVNKFLTITSEESFSALDICVVDLRKCTCDIIKLGAPYGILKHRNESEVIPSGSLPLGILEEIKPIISQRKLLPNDIIILATDGVTDVFADSESFRQFVAQKATLNPQELADAILKHCVKADKNLPHDDMSVIAARIFPLV